MLILVDIPQDLLKSRAGWQSNPRGLTFGSQPAGTTSAPQSLVISNVGSKDLTITGAAFKNATGPQFVVAGQSCGSPLPRDASCQIDVAFAPTAQGNLTDALVISGSTAGIHGESAR